ncbi:hypothetical protein G5I_02525 [Acromyrmex echinatior]|uniref:Uncharacterized protein n=1 Tax=Acromyrmex echinatior TaxID=103372 RepID=F4WAI8_ACREC|nr:hypothetical protein G5I_02525 [Acromyrmex echinatior]
MSRPSVATESTNRYGTTISPYKIHIKAIAIHPMLPNEIVGYTGFIACVYIYDITLSHTSALFGFSERATSSWRQKEKRLTTVYNPAYPFTSSLKPQLDDGSVTSSADPKAEIARLRFN